MTAPGPSSTLMAQPLPRAPGKWWLEWVALGGEPRGCVFHGPLDELSEWAYAHGFTGVEVRPPLH